MSRLIDPDQIQDLTIAFAGIALHGMLSGGSMMDHELLVERAFDMAREFLRQAEATS